MRTVFFVIISAVVLGWATKFSMMLVGSETAIMPERVINSEPQPLAPENDLLHYGPEDFNYDF